MAQKARLRLNRYGTIINLTSKQQETEMGQAVIETSEIVTSKFGFSLEHRKSIQLGAIVNDLREAFPTIPFSEPFARSSMNPDGGILSVTMRDGGKSLPILISEAKNQGTNDLRAQEGLKKQSMGNAIERLGKNVIGFRTMMLDAGITPFVCFGYGIDFDEGSSILDRVKTIAMFGELNEVSVINLGENGQFNRGSFYFRRARWTRAEMIEVMTDVATRSIHYYLAKYGDDAFVPAIVD